MLEPPEVPPQNEELFDASGSRTAFGLLLAPGRGWIRSLRHAGYRQFWTGNFISNVGTWMQNVAQGWLVLQLTNSPLWLGLVGFAQQVPVLIFSLFGGVIADRASRQKLLMATQTALLLLALVLAVLVSRGVVTVRQIMVIAVLAGTTTSLNAPTYQAAIRDLVPEEDTLNAIALNSIQFNLSRVAGPSLAGFAIAGLGLAACFYLNALSFVPLIFILWRVPFPLPHVHQSHSVRAELAEGFRYVRENRSVLMLVLIVAMVSMFGLPYLVMMPAFARDVLHVGAAGLGYLVAAAGAGALLGGIRLATFHPKRRRGPQVLGAALVFYTAIFLFCFSRHPAISALLLAVVGGAMVNTVATVNSLIQTLVPAAIRGRVLSMHTMAFLGFTPLGSLLVGMLSGRWGAPGALAISSGFALILMAGIVIAVPSLRSLH